MLAGGAESMSRVPYLLTDARWGYRMGHQAAVDAMYQDGFLCPLAEQLMGETAETLAEHVRDHARGAGRVRAAQPGARGAGRIAEGRFDAEIVPVVAPGGPGRGDGRARRASPRRRPPLASLGKLPPVFKDEGGTVTAGNSSGITDGAAAMLVMRRRDRATR